VKRARIDLAALFRSGDIYWYWNGFNAVAILWTLLGFVIYIYLPTSVMKTISTVLICGIGYCVTTRLVSTDWSALANASRPGEQHGTVEDLAWQLAER
jgi:cytosine/uracil/thiamine/allantoin permease